MDDVIFVFRDEVLKRFLKNKILVALINPILIIIILGILGDCIGEPVFVLEVNDYHNDRNILQLTINPHEVFYLKTIHSVGLTPYIHIYKIDKEGNIILSGVIFESGGGGFPVPGDGVFSIKDGKFLMDKMNRFIGKLHFRVSPVSKETLLISNIELPLYKMVPEGTLIEIKISKGRNQS